MSERHLASERIGQFFVETDGGRDRLEYTEHGTGDAWVVLLPGLLMPRRMHDHLARTLASAGMHVVTLDLLGHGRSDRPDDPFAYSVTSFARQVVALLDELGAAQAVIGRTSLGAKVTLDVAGIAPDRVRGLIVEIRIGDGFYGWEERGPFDAILVTAAAAKIPERLAGQLRDGGRLVMPLGEAGQTQGLMRARKTGDRINVVDFTEVLFVPLRGAVEKQDR